MHGPTTGLLLGAAALLGSLGAAAAYPPGDSTAVVDVNATSIELLIYKPPAYRGEGLIVSVHGLARNAEGYREYTRTLAERFQALLVVPRFDAERFPGWRFQRAGIARGSDETGALAVEPSEQWTGEILRAVIAQVRAEESRSDMPYVLLGHSAGAQFLLRTTALAPLDAVRVVIANPSSWLAPSTTEPYPYGFAGLPPQLADERVLQRYLAQPVTVLLGTADTGSRNLSRTAGALRQGEHRYARGSNVYRAAAAMARSRGWDFGWRIVEIPEVGHSPRAMYASPLAERAFCPDPAPIPARASARTLPGWPCDR